MTENCCNKTLLNTLLMSSRKAEEIRMLASHFEQAPSSAFDCLKRQTSNKPHANYHESSFS